MGAPSSPEKVSALVALLRGGLQGASYGFGDELDAGWHSLFPKELGGEDYQTRRDRLRIEDADAEKDHPALYKGARFVGQALPTTALILGTGGAASPLAASLPAAMGTGAATGALSGAGFSDADDAKGVALDSLIGGGIGGATGAVTYGAGKLASSLFRGAKPSVGQAAANEPSVGVQLRNEQAPTAQDMINSVYRSNHPGTVPLEPESFNYQPSDAMQSAADNARQSPDQYSPLARLKLAQAKARSVVGPGDPLKPDPSSMSIDRDPKIVRQVARALAQQLRDGYTKDR